MRRLVEGVHQGIMYALFTLSIMVWWLDTFTAIFLVLMALFMNVSRIRKGFQ